MNKVLEGFALGKNYNIYEVTGLVVNASTRQKVEKTYIQSKGGYPDHQSTKVTNFQYLTLKLGDGGEVNIELKNIEVPCRWHDKVTVWGLGKNFFPFAALNHYNWQFDDNRSDLAEYLVAWIWIILWIAVFALGLYIYYEEHRVPISDVGGGLSNEWHVFVLTSFASLPIWLVMRFIASLQGMLIRSHLNSYRKKHIKSTSDS